MQTVYMERATGATANQIKCRYCHFMFTPEPVISKAGRKHMTYIECPRCGNGIERATRWYDRQRAVSVHG